MGIYPRMHEGHPVFRVDFNCEGPQGATVDVDDLWISDPDAADLSVQPLCSLRPEKGVREQLPASGWEYGRPVPGYRVVGACEPLTTGRRYEVSVIGPGVGGTVFVVGADGTLQVEKGDCLGRRGAAGP